MKLKEKLKNISNRIKNRINVLEEKRKERELEKVKRVILIEEYALIKAHKSHFTKNQRDYVIKKVEGLIKKGKISSKDFIK